MLRVHKFQHQVIGSISQIFRVPSVLIFLDTILHGCQGIAVSIDDLLPHARDFSRELGSFLFAKSCKQNIRMV